jgi:peptidoglycan/xylan/chitin deacetylase (PgdA/CDA1 family)
MKERMSKCLLIVVLLLCLQLSVEMTVYAEEPGADIRDAEQQGWWKKDKEKPDFPDLKGGPEKPERVRQQPVDMAILQQQFPGTFILQGPTDQNRIALTFDDGPDPRFTEDVLDVLDQYNVPATFFLLGSRAAAYPEIVERINNEGHIIGNHTYFHPNLVKEGDIPTLEREVTRTEGTLNDIINFRTALFRPPYGFLYSELVEKLAEMQYVIIGWSVDSLDWVEDPPEIIASTVLDNVQPGAIILLHDGADWDGDRTNTVEALKQIIPALQEQGYEFVTVPDLLNIPFAK